MSSLKTAMKMAYSGDLNKYVKATKQQPRSNIETTINLKENKFIFGEMIYLKSRAERKAANHYR